MTILLNELLLSAMENGDVILAWIGYIDEKLKKSCSTRWVMQADVVNLAMTNQWIRFFKKVVLVSHMRENYWSVLKGWMQYKVLFFLGLSMLINYATIVRPINAPTPQRAVTHLNAPNAN